jgi:hypothetical protein
LSGPCAHTAWRRRHGTAVLYAGLNVHDGEVTAWVTDSTRADNFIAFLADLVAATPAGLELHCIVDNLSAHGTAAVAEFLDDPAITMCSCTARPPTPRGSIRSSCSFRSCNGGSAMASSTPSTT